MYKDSNHSFNATQINKRSNDANGLKPWKK